MNYPYNNRNLIDKPEHYMYSNYRGGNLFKSYFNNRSAILIDYKGSKQENAHFVIIQSCNDVIKKFISKNSPELSNKYFTSFDFYDEREFTKTSKNNYLNKIKKINISLDESINTSKLLDTIFSATLEGSLNSIKIWLDRLVQRFEVTKKIYEQYMPGFIKGKGKNNLVTLYWYFGIVLTVFYAKTNNIKYLNTLIKVCDLILSLPLNELEKNISNLDLSFLLSSEIAYVKILLQIKRVNYLDG